MGNVYLHCAIDLRFDKVVRPGLRGEAQLVRHADDPLVLFEDETDAQHFAQALPERLAQFGLEVAPEKARRIPFGAKFWRQGEDATGTFEFPGFSHHLRTNRQGRLVVLRVKSCSRSAIFETVAIAIDEIEARAHRGGHNGRLCAQLRSGVVSGRGLGRAARQR